MDLEEAVKLLKEMQENCKNKTIYKDEKAEAKSEAIKVVLEELEYLGKKLDKIEREYQDYRILSVGITHLELLIREARVISEAEERDEKTKEYYKTRLKCLLDLYSELYNSKTVLDYIPKDKIRDKLDEIMSYTFTSIEERHQQNYAYDRIRELLEEEQKQ